MIIAIGGGELSSNQTLEIDKYIVKSAEKKQPKLLFIPTASKDSPTYVEAVNSVYGSLGCYVDVLYLCNDYVDGDKVKGKIEKADIIYVGGGNTEFMMDKWREYFVDKYLLEAYEQNKVLSGLSAGAICWFIAGHSKSEFKTEIENPKDKWVKGLGIIPYLHCPHYDNEDRKSFDDTFMQGQSMPAIAIENRAAIVWDNGDIKVIKAIPEKHVYYIAWENDTLIKRVKG
ncbi:MAG: type 1 glutamine amidotransferase-like domain-containing protein [Christensenellaceae bacterium]|nr:type 1 glutamine amidotransferase-like domain-containing protein [Christensenellaceae bacterium]